MFDGADKAHIDYWYTGKLVDCGSITNKNDCCEDFEIEYEEFDYKKLNNNHSHKQPISNNDNNTSKNTNSITSSFRISRTNINNETRYLHANSPNKNIRSHQTKEANTNNNLSTKINSNNYKGKMHSDRLLTNSRLSEFKSQERKVLLDSFPKYRINKHVKN